MAGIMDFLEGLDNISALLEVLLIIVPAIIAFFCGKYGDKSKKRKLRKLLRFNNSKNAKCEIILPIRTGDLELTADEINILLSGSKKSRDVLKQSLHSYKYIRMEEAEIILEAQKIMDTLSLNQPIVFVEPDKENEGESKFINNKIICGGPLSNECAKEILLKGRKAGFPLEGEFKIGYREERYEHAVKFGTEELIVKVGSGKKALFFGPSGKPFDELEKYEYTDDYVVLIRKTLKPYENNCGTILLCFGSSARATLAAVECLTDHTNFLYKKLKKHRNQFFVIAQVTKTGKLCFEDSAFRDITDIMFGPENTCRKKSP